MERIWDSQWSCRADRNSNSSVWEVRIYILFKLLHFGVCYGIVCYLNRYEQWDWLVRGFMAQPVDRHCNYSLGMTSLAQSRWGIEMGSGDEVQQRWLLGLPISFSRLPLKSRDGRHWCTLPADGFREGEHAPVCCLDPLAELFLVVQGNLYFFLRMKKRSKIKSTNFIELVQTGTPLSRTHYLSRTAALRPSRGPQASMESTHWSSVTSFLGHSTILLWSSFC